MTPPASSVAARAAPTTAPARLAAEAVALLGRLLDRTRGVVLLDVPSHPNVGDSAIWMGERAALAALGHVPALECDLDTFDADRLRPAVEGRTVLIHGGGNLGDLWPPHQALRETAIAAFHARPVIQLPQSLHFRSPESLARARAVFAGHPDLTLLCRDERSVEIAVLHFDRARVERCPDLALCLPRRLLRLPRRRALRRASDVLWLVRSDHESAWADGAFPPAARDWLDEPTTLSMATARRLAPRAARRRGAGAIRTLHARALRRAAARRVTRGVALLSSARVVVTDRLHAHILCVLLRLPHVLLDDAFGKVAAHCAAWPELARFARRARDPEEAGAHARRLLSGEEA